MQYSRDQWRGTVVTHAIVSIPNARFFVTPSKANLMVPMKTSDIAKAYGLSLVVNAGGFDYVGKLVVSRGQVIYRGHKPYGRRAEQSFYISKRNLITFIKGKGSPFFAVPYPNRLVSKGMIVNHSAPDITPRTFIGIKGEYMTFAVIEGIDGQSGATIGQTAELCHEWGFENAILFDSGYSSTICIDAIVRNVPADGGISGREAAVCTHFGVY
jgi:exopolysaccharide biosynthesis protein